MPERFQSTDRLGFPAELTVAVNDCAAPNSVCAADGETEIETSLWIVTTAVTLFDGSATLVACTETAAGDGSVAGAV